MIKSLHVFLMVCFDFVVRNVRIAHRRADFGVTEHGLYRFDRHPPINRRRCHRVTESVRNYILYSALFRQPVKTSPDRCRCDPLVWSPLRDKKRLAVIVSSRNILTYTHDCFCEGYSVKNCARANIFHILRNILLTYYAICVNI